jgi:hypothetical protein
LHFLMQRTRTDPRLAFWHNWLGRLRGAADSAPARKTVPPKASKSKVRASSKSGKHPMLSLVRLRPVDLSRAFRQAPWRVQVQVIASLAATAIVVVALGGLYLTEASRAATAGRDVQALQVQKSELEFLIDRQLALIAQAKSVERLEQRARDLGYVPAEIGQIDYILVEGYYGPQYNLPVDAAPAPRQDLPNYNESLGTWLVGMLSSVLGSGG